MVTREVEYRFVNLKMEEQMKSFGTQGERSVLLSFLFTLIFISLISVASVGAISVVKDTIFRPTGSSCDYFMADSFNFTGITVYSTALKMNDGNITTYPSSGWIKMSMENLTTTSIINFTNNVTAANITIENGFANFSVTDNYAYIIWYQSNDTKYLSKVASGSSVQFTDIPSGSWYITVDTVAPTISNIIVTPNSVLIDESVTISCDVTDVDSGIASVLVRIEDAKNKINSYALSYSSGNTYALEYRDLSKEGLYSVLSFNASDNSGNWQNETSTLTFTALSPSVDEEEGVTVPTPTAPPSTTTPPSTSTPPSPTSAPQSEPKDPPIVTIVNIIEGTDALDIIIIIIAGIGTLFGAYFGYHQHKKNKQPLILKIGNDFLKPTIDQLKKDRRNINQIDDSSFPDFLNFRFGISDKSLQSDIFSMLIKRKPLLKKEIQGYNKSCSELNKQIGELKNLGYDEGLITDKTTTRDLNLEAIVTKIKMEDRYENSDRAEILKERGLDGKIEEIKSLIRRSKLDKKAENLIQRLEKIKEKYRDKYELVDV